MTKKISIITIFDNPNFGTYLQALALGIVLQNKGTKVDIVHYERPAWRTFPKLLLKFNFLEPLYHLKTHLCKNKCEIQRIKCRKFVRKYVNITKTYYSYSQLEQDPPKSDIYLTGSDQVWNTIHNHGIDKAFYLGYAPDEAPKFAYAASIGMSSIPDKYIDEFKRLLSRYKAISVREDSSVGLLSTIGIKSESVIDPTFLLNYEQWKMYAKPMKFDEPYLLVYSVESKERDVIVGEVAQKVAKIKGLKIYEINYLGANKTIPGCEKHFFYATPDLFLTLLSNAKYVVVSSFHGTAFSINFNKDFLSVVPDRFSSRLDGILELTGLQSRKVSCIEQVTENLINTSIDFSISKKALDTKIKKSMDYINSILA